MPVSFKIDKERKLVICTVFGELVDADGPTGQRLLLEDPDFDPSFSQLLDLTQVTKVDMDAETVRTLARTSVFSSDARRALVANSAVLFGFARMFELLREPVGGAPVQVFRSREEALHWLLEENAK